MTPDGFGIGASTPRKEDARHLRGRGCFVSDIAMAGLQDVAFLRSPVAHARIVRRAKPAAHAANVFFRDDLVGAAPIVTRSAMAGYKLVGVSSAGRRTRAFRWRTGRHVHRREPRRGRRPDGTGRG